MGSKRSIEGNPNTEIDARAEQFFRAVYQAKNISRAADALYVSRQSVSLRMAQLEADLGVPLFTRGKAGAEPTPYAVKLLEYLDSRELLWNEFREHLPAAEAQKEVIRVGMQSSVFEQEDIHRVLQFEESHPWASIEIVSGPQDSFLPALSKGELEAAYVTGLGDREYENLARIKIVDQPVRVLMAANDPLADRPAVDFYSDLGGRAVLFAGVHSSEANWEKLRRAGISMTTLPDSRNVLKEKVIRGQGVAFVLADIVERFEADGMACVPLVNCDMDTCSYLAYRKDLGEKARAFVRHILGFHGLGGVLKQD